VTPNPGNDASSGNNNPPNPSIAEQSPEFSGLN
jgi:hypothetical protein